jgi:hypothetical protein
MTLICQRPLVSAGALCAVLAAAVALLEELDRARQDSATLEWSVAAVLIGHSEYLDTARVAVELIGQPATTVNRGKAPDIGIYPALAAGLNEVRTAANLPVGFSDELVARVQALAEVLHGEISELWFSQPGAMLAST